MNKVIRDGKVAVIYSPGFGAGWYTWNTEFLDCVFNPRLVSAVEDGNLDLVYELAGELYGEEFYTGGAEDLAIKWLPAGTAFTIDVYDGSESIKLADDLILMA